MFRHIEKWTIINDGFEISNLEEQLDGYYITEVMVVDNYFCQSGIYDILYISIRYVLPTNMLA